MSSKIETCPICNRERVPEYVYSLNGNRHTVQCPYIDCGFRLHLYNDDQIAGKAEIIKYWNDIALRIKNYPVMLEVLKESVLILEANATSIETYTRIVGPAKKLIEQYEVTE